MFKSNLSVQQMVAAVPPPLPSGGKGEGQEVQPGGLVVCQPRQC